MRIYKWLFLIGCIISCGCTSVEIDSVILDTQLQNAAKSISTADELDAEQVASEEYSRAVKLLRFSKQAQERGENAQSMEFAYQAELVAQIALYQAKQQQAKTQFISIREQMYQEAITQKDYEIEIEKIHKEMKSIELDEALKTIEGEQQIASGLTTDLNDTKKALHRAEISLPITVSEVYVSIAKQIFAEIEPTSGYEKVQSAIKTAKSHLERGEFSEGKIAATDAQAQAITLLDQAIQFQVTQNSAETAAQIAIERAKLKTKRAESLNAATHTPQQFQELQNQLNNANTAFQESRYEQARQGAETAELTADKVISTSEVSEYRQRAQQEQATKVKNAKEAVATLKTVIAEQEQTKVPQFAPQLYELATSALSKAESALSTKEYSASIDAVQQSHDYLKRAIEKTKDQNSAQTTLVETINEIPKTIVIDREEGVLIRINGRLFATTSTQLKEEFFPTFMKLAAILQQDAFKDYVVKIEGHTDSLGQAGTNKALSNKRANSIKQFLINNGKISADRLTAIGLGETQPIDPNSEAKNRRIDIYIDRPQ